jgi:hypothetical protein
MYFEILGDIADVETFAIGSSIREIARLRKSYGAVAGESAKEALASG